MKKTTIIICTFIIAVMLMLGGCSCTPAQILSFTNEFNGGTRNSETNLSVNYLEKLTYDVNYNESYSTIKKDPTLKEEQLPKFSDGKYVMEFKGNVNLPADISQDFDYVGNKYLLKTRFDIDVSVNDKTYHDSIITECYFFNAENAFAPVYSDVKIKNTLISIGKKDGKDNTFTETQVRNYITKYTKSNYSIEKLYLKGTEEEISAFDIDNFDKSKLTPEKEIKTYGYVAKESIDNTQLMFALRNMVIAEKQSKNISVISPVYEKATHLSVRNSSDSTFTFTKPVSYNGTESKLDMPVRNYMFAISGQDNTGIPQYMSIQKEKTDAIPYRAVPVEYAQAMIEYGGLKCSGVLVYTLKSIDFTK